MHFKIIFFFNSDRVLKKFLIPKYFTYIKYHYFFIVMQWV